MIPTRSLVHDPVTSTSLPSEVVRDDVDVAKHDEKEPSSTSTGPSLSLASSDQIGHAAFPVHKDLDVPDGETSMSEVDIIKDDDSDQVGHLHPDPDPGELPKLISSAIRAAKEDRDRGVRAHHKAKKKMSMMEDSKKIDKDDKLEGLLKLALDEYSSALGRLTEASLCVRQQQSLAAVPTITPHSVPEDSPPAVMSPMSPIIQEQYWEEEEEEDKDDSRGILLSDLSEVLSGLTLATHAERSGVYSDLQMHSEAATDLSAAIRLMQPFLGDEANADLLGEGEEEGETAAAYRGKKKKKSKNKLRRSKSKNDLRRSLMTKRVRCFIAIGRLDDAVEDLKALLRDHQEEEDDGDKIAELFFVRSGCFLKMELHDLALSDATNALHFREAFPECLVRRAKCLEKLGRIPDSLLDLCAAIRLRSTFADARFARATLLHSAGSDHDLDAAIGDYTAMLQVDHRNTAVLIRRSIAFAAIGKLDESFVDLEFAFRVDPSLPGLDKERKTFDPDGTLEEVIQKFVMTPGIQ